MEEPSLFFSTLESIGETEVRVKLAQAVWSEHRKVALVKEWLARKSDERASEASAKRDEREEKTLSIAKDALAIAEESNRIASEELAAAQASASSAVEQARWARWAAIIAMVAAVISTKDQILALIFGNP